MSLTGFQLVNLATANYGFFVYLALALHVFLLDERDLVRAGDWLRGKLRRPTFTLPEPVIRWRELRMIAAGLFATAYVGLSAIDATIAFAEPRGEIADATIGVRKWVAPFRLVHVYHLFGSITRERIEPEFQTSDGSTWTAHDLHDKAGDPMRPPPLVAPHQPRVDFLLWFYGLSFRRGTPGYVAAILDRMCHEPATVAPLFVDELPPAPAAVRIVFWRYHFTTPEERAASGAWWSREQVAALRPMDCALTP